MFRMYLKISMFLFTATLAAAAASSKLEDACTSADCAIRNGEEVSDSLHMLQRGSRAKAARERVNTTEMMLSDAFEGYRWRDSDTAAACSHEANNVQDTILSHSEISCKSKCLEAGYCMAVDFHTPSGRCHLYTSPCDKPASLKDGLSSHNLEIFMGSLEGQEADLIEPVNVLEPSHHTSMSLAQKAEPEEEEKEETAEPEEKEKKGEPEKKKKKKDRVSEARGGKEGLRKQLETLEVEQLADVAKESEVTQEALDAIMMQPAPKDLLIEAILAKAEYNEYENEYLEEQVVAAVSFSLIFVFILTHVMHRNDIHNPPEAVMIIGQGVILGLLLKYWADSNFMKDSTLRAEISIELLNLVFLPLLMFESGWSVRRLDFVSQFPYIMIFAVIGTLISTGVIGMLIYKSGQAGYHTCTHYRSAFTVAALISTTDPVATLGTYSHLKVDPLLNIIVFGEAAINDAVGIVVFSIVNDDAIMAQFDGLSDMLIFGTIAGLRILSCSFLLGLAVCILICGALRVFRMHDNKKLEIMIVVCSCYLAFALGEYFKVSGIICTLFAGMLMGQYARPHLSIEGSLLTSFFISQMCMVMDAGVFLLSGVCCICLHLEGQKLGYWLLLFCAIGRICSTIPCGILTNFTKNRLNSDISVEERHLLAPKYLFMIWHAGLRGGIAENLAMQIGTWMNDLEGPHAKEAIRSSVFLVVGAYVCIFGGTTKMFLDFFKIPMGSDYAEDILSGKEAGMEDSRVAMFLHESMKWLLIGSAAEKENDDVDETINEEADVEELLKQVTHLHRGSKPLQKDAVEKLEGRPDMITES